MKQWVLILLFGLLPVFFGCSSMKTVEDDMVKLLEHMEIDSLSKKPAGAKTQTPEPAAPAPAADSQMAQSSDDGNYSLTIQAFPRESTIRVMNIKSRYYPGLRLPAGKYDVLVEYPGYKPYREWISLGYDLIMKVILKESGEAYMAQSHDPTPPEPPPESEIAADRGGDVPPAAEAAPGAVAKSKGGEGMPSVLSGHYGSVSSFAFSPDGRLLASGGYDGMVLLWNVADGSIFQHLNHQDRVAAVAFSPDGGTLASAGSDRNIKLWSVKSGELLKTLSGHTTRIHSLAFERSGGVLISGGDNELILWEFNTGKIKTLIVGDDQLYPVFGAIRTIAVRPGGGDRQGFAFAFTCNAGISLFNPETKELQLLPDTAPPYSVAYRPDGACIAWGARHLHQHDVFFPRIVSLETKERDPLLSRDDEMAKADRVFYTSYTPDGGRLVMLTYNQAVLYDIQTGTVVRKFTGTSETAVTDAALSPDGRILAVSAKDSIKIWTIK